MPRRRGNPGIRRYRSSERALRVAAPLAVLALVAAGCGASLGGRYDSATTAPRAARATGATSSTLHVVTAQPLPLLDPAFATSRQSRALANLLCTPLVRFADAEGLPGTVIVPGLARDLPIISRGSRTFRVQLLGGLRFADGKRLTTEDVRATFDRLLDPATRSPGRSLFTDILGSKDFAEGKTPRVRGVRATGGQITFQLKRSDPAFLARLAMPIACPTESGTPHTAVRGLLAQQATGRYRVAEHTSSLIDLTRATVSSNVPNGASPGAAARISVTHLRSAEALQEEIAAGSADLSLDDLPGSATPGLAVPSDAIAVLRLNPSRWPLSDENVRRALSLALDRSSLAGANGGDVAGTSSLLLDPQAPSPAQPNTAEARSLLRRAGAEGTLQLEIWAEPGSQARVARAIAVQLGQVGVRVTVRIATATERPASVRAWLQWLTPAYGDPAAIFTPLAEQLPPKSQDAIAKRVRGTARLAGDARRAAFRRLDERLGNGGLGAIPLLRANFSTPVSSMLVGRGTHPVFDIDLAQLHTRS